MSTPASARSLPPPRAVLFDALGTLVALEPPAPRLRAELARHGFEVSGAAVEAAIRAEIAFYLEHHLEGRDEGSLAALRDRCAEVVHAALDVPSLDRATAREAMLDALSFRAQPDAAPTLGKLRAGGVRLVAASNWDCSLAHVLDAAGLAALLDGAVSSATVGAAKPDPRVFEAALAVAGVAPEEAVHVGDSEANDVVGARAAGVRAVLLDRQAAGAEASGRAPPAAYSEAGSGERAPQTAGAFPVIGTLEELPTLVLERQ